MPPAADRDTDILALPFDDSGSWQLITKELSQVYAVKLLVYMRSLVGL